MSRLALLGLNIETYATLCASMNQLCTFRFMKSNAILFFFHPSYSIEVEETESLHYAIVSRQAIPNVAAGEYGIVHNGVVLQLKGIDTLSVCPVSVSKSLRNVGGISVLLPLLDLYVCS